MDKTRTELKDQESIVRQIMSSIQEEISAFVAEESSITDSVEYEERVLAISRKFAQQLIIQTQGKVGKSRNTKKKS